MPDRLRYIGGFGEIFWLEAETIAQDPARDPAGVRAAVVVVVKAARARVA